MNSLKPCPHCRRKVRLSQKTAIVAEFGDSGQSHFSATVWIGLNKEINVLCCSSIGSAMSGPGSDFNRWGRRRSRGPQASHPSL